MSGENVKNIETPKFAFGPLICYEDIFPEMSRKEVLMGALFLVNITNNAWFGKTSAPFQHLAMSVMRAVETKRYMVRSTNTGVSAIVDPTGRILVESLMYTPAILVSDISLMDIKTPYVKYGDWFAYGCVVYVFLGLVMVCINRKKSVV